MNLLVISSNPNRASYRQRIEVYLDTLRHNGIDCETAVLPRGYSNRRKLFKSARNFDAVFLHKKKLSPVDAFWLGRYGKKIIYNFDDAVMFDENEPEKDKLLRLMPFRRTVKMADMIIVGSSYLSQLARRFNSRVEILPLGLRVSDYNVAPPVKKDEKIRLVWIGSASTLKYLEEIKPVIENVGIQSQNVVLRIIGDTFFDLPSMPVEKHTWSEQSKGVDLAACDIGLAPLPGDRFTQGKCSFKVLEYSAAGLPVVASPVGTNTDYVQQGVTGFLVKSPAEWIEKITILVKDRLLRRKMGEKGRLFARQFDVAVIGKRLCEVIVKCLADRRK